MTDSPSPRDMPQKRAEDPNRTRLYTSPGRMFDVTPPIRHFLVTYREGITHEAGGSEVISRETYTVREGVFVFGDGPPEAVKMNIVSIPADIVKRVEEIAPARAIDEASGGDGRAGYDFDHDSEVIPEKDRGLYAKYRVVNIATGREVDQPTFVLKPNTDPLARTALRQYAVNALRAGYPQLHEDLVAWLDDIVVNLLPDEAEAVKPSSDFADPATDFRAEHPPEAMPDGEPSEPAIGETGTCMTCVGSIEYRQIEMDPDEPDKRTWVHVMGKKNHPALPQSMPD